MANRRLIDRQAGAVEASKAWPAERRSACITLDAPDESGAPFTAVVAIGPERARSLQRLYFEPKALAAELSVRTGVVSEDCDGTHGLRLSVPSRDTPARRNGRNDPRRTSP